MRRTGLGLALLLTVTVAAQVAAGGWSTRAPPVTPSVSAGRAAHPVHSSAVQAVHDVLRHI